MRIDQDIKLDYDDVLIRPKRSTLVSRKDVELERTMKFLHTGKEWTGIPIMTANMDGVATKSMMKALSKHKIITVLHKYYRIEDYKDIEEEYTYITVGIKDEDWEKLNNIQRLRNIHYLCIDVANGYTERFVEFIKRSRELLPHAIIMAGNVVTGEMTEQLILSGADIVKVGIGPGSTCITRKMTGVGYPQLSAVIECADAAHGVKGFVCADGGCRVVGDLVKAFAAGGDFVMMGGMFAGHTESEFPLIEKEGKQYVEHYGSSSAKAMEKHYGGKANYKASEGKYVLLPYKGSVEDTVEEILGGLRSACTYVGAAKLKELTKRTTFVRVNRQLNNAFSQYEA